MQALDPVCLGQGLVLCLGAIAHITKGGVADMDVSHIGEMWSPSCVPMFGFPMCLFLIHIKLPI